MQKCKLLITFLGKGNFQSKRQEKLPLRLIFKIVFDNQMIISTTHVLEHYIYFIGSNCGIK